MASRTKRSDRGAQRFVRAVCGALMIAIGAVFSSAHMLTLERAVWWGGLCLAAAGALWLADSFLRRRHAGIRSRCITSLLWFALGLYMMLADQQAVHLLPYIAAACLVAIGVVKLVRGVKLRAVSPGRALPDMGEGGLALAVGIVLAAVTWLEAMELIAGTVAIGAFLYGCILLIGALVRVPKETPELIKEQDHEIAEQRDASFRELERELNKK